MSSGRWRSRHWRQGDDMAHREEESVAASDGRKPWVRGARNEVVADAPVASPPVGNAWGRTPSCLKTAGQTPSFKASLEKPVERPLKRPLKTSSERSSKDTENQEDDATIRKSYVANSKALPKKNAWGKLGTLEKSSEESNEKFSDKSSEKSNDKSSGNSMDNPRGRPSDKPSDNPTSNPGRNSHAWPKPNQSAKPSQSSSKPASSLPSSSSWGNTQPANSKQPPQPHASGFPSLSAAISAAPRRPASTLPSTQKLPKSKINNGPFKSASAKPLKQQQHQQQQPTKILKPPSSKDNNNTKNKNNNITILSKSKQEKSVKPLPPPLSKTKPAPDNLSKDARHDNFISFRALPLKAANNANPNAAIPNAADKDHASGVLNTPFHAALHGPINGAFKGPINNGAINGAIDKNIAVSWKKGRQSLGPRKKKLTTLKKRVLEERLRAWKEKNGTMGGDTMDNDTIGKTRTTAKNAREDECDTHPIKRAKVDPSFIDSSTTLALENFICPEEDDLMDVDEYEEICSNLMELASQAGKVLSVFIPQPISPDNNNDVSKDTKANLVGWSFVRFTTNQDASAANGIFNGLVVAGQSLRAHLLKLTLPTNHTSPFTDLEWQNAVLRTMTPQEEATLKHSASTQSHKTIVFHNILCEDDYDDEDALQESIRDVEGLAQMCGLVDGARAVLTGEKKGNVHVTFVHREDAEKAVHRWNGIMMGGSNIHVTLEESSHSTDQEQSPTSVVVLLTNILNENDFEDEDCLNESINDISNMAREHGIVGKVFAETSGENKGRVHIEYLQGLPTAEKAIHFFDGNTIGGMIVSATLSDHHDHDQDHDHRPTKPPPLYSGNKLIPERYAACKRVPKIPNAGTPRPYAIQRRLEDPSSAIPLLIEMLGELMRLQQRSKEDKNARARRRIVMGLREVARGIRAHKVKMVVMANNLDEYGAIDSKLEEILQLAQKEELPVIFELNKRKLGKAVGKGVKVSVVGIQNADGAHEQFKKLKKMVNQIGTM